MGGMRMMIVGATAPDERNVRLGRRLVVERQGVLDPDDPAGRQYGA